MNETRVTAVIDLSLITLVMLSGTIEQLRIQSMHESVSNHSDITYCAREICLKVPPLRLQLRSGITLKAPHRVHTWAEKSNYP